MQKAFSRMALTAILPLFLAAELSAATIVTITLNETLASQFSRIEMFIKTSASGEVFSASGGLSNFSVGGWGDTNVTPLWTKATGPATTSTNFNLVFNYATGPVLPIKFDLFAFGANGGLLDGAKFDYNGFQFQYTGPATIATYNADVTAASATPEVGTVLLTGIGLAPLFFVRNRFSPQAVTG